MSSPRRRRAERIVPPAEEPVTPAAADAAELVATNTGVRLACTMAAMMSPFAVFLCWAEKENHAIRRFAVQSCALLVLHAVLAGILLLAGWLLSGVPYLGLLVKLVCYLAYVAGLVALLALRVRLMERAWHGRRCELPMLEGLLARYY